MQATRVVSCCGRLVLFLSAMITNPLFLKKAQESLLQRAALLTVVEFKVN
jgi:hypothetical protein